MLDDLQTRAEDVIRRERAQISTAWYRKTWAQPTLWLYPALSQLSKDERTKLIDDAKLQAKSSVVLIGAVMVWLLTCVTAWLVMSPELRSLLGTMIIVLPALGAVFARAVAIHVAIRKSLAIQRSFEIAKQTR